MHTNIHSIKILFVFVLTIFAVPVFVQADYVYNGKHFDSFEKMQDYIVAYMEAWREVYGENDVDPKSASAVPRVRNKIAVETSYVRDLEYSSARFVGELDLKKSERARVWFDYGLSPSRLNARTKTEVIGDLYGSDIFDQKAVNLIPETTYYYRAGAINEDGVVVHGETKHFTTPIDTENTNALINARTSHTEDVDDTHAIIKGYVTFKRETLAYVWFEYGDDEDDLYKKTPIQKMYKDDGYYSSAVIQRLDEDQKYYYRFLAMDINGDISYGKIRDFKTREDTEDKAPEAETMRANDIAEYSATLTGRVDMNDFRDGVVFFVYGEDRNEIAEVAEDYDRYSEIRERGDERQKVLVDSDLDRFDEYTVTVSYLDQNTYHYYAIGVAYEDEDGDDTIALGRIYTLRTKRDNT